MAERRTTEQSNPTLSRQKQREVKQLSGKKYAGKSMMWMILRIVIVVLILGIAAVIGAMVGYGVIGDGKMMDVLDPSTWTHVFDIMNGKED